MNRKTIREWAFKFLYELEVHKTFTTEQLEIFLENNEIKDEEAKEYILAVVEGVEKNKEKITALISNNLKKDWQIERIAKIDLALLKLSIYEILYTDIPFKAAINEVIELAKKYGDDASPAFINGILANVVK